MVILLDNSGTMLPYYDEVNTKVLTEICDNFVRLGDTFHLLSFNEKPVTEISQPVKTEADIYKIISRFNLLYPLGPYTDFPSALQYAQQYIASLDVYNQKVLIIISDGLFNPASNSTFYNKTPEEINSVIDSTISKMKSEGTHIYYIKAPFPENLNLKSITDESITNLGDETDTTVYFEYGTALENSEEVETSALVPDENTTYNSDSFIGPILSMPEISTKKDFGNKKLNFTLPITIKNTSDEKIKLELTQVLINDKNVLEKSVFVNIKANNSKKVKAKIEMPEDTQLGQQQIFAECVFADNVRTRPQYLDFFVNFKSGTNIFANFKSIGFTILIILLILLAIILLLLLLVSISKKHKEEEERQEKLNKQKAEDKTIYNEAKNITEKKKDTAKTGIVSAKEQKDSNTTITKKTSASSRVVSDTSNSDTLNGYGKSSGLAVTGDGSSNRMDLNASKQKNSLTLDGAEKYKDSNFAVKLGSADNKPTNIETSDDKTAKISSNKMSMPAFKKPEGLRLPVLGSKSSSNSITPASSSESIEAKSDKDIILELYVEGQNKNIGKRNIHTLSPGSRRSVGGGLSSFSIFLVQVPASIAEVRYDGETCSLALLQPEYFPEATSNIIENCINKKIKVRSNKGYEMNITIRPYEDQTDKLNNLLLSIFDDSQKQRYTKN
ncbi:MAG: VWA domain-containing protein [Spirochaetaceae bacterium]|nr:VWA domain-containing protein [Spirochaetaceae bacterium]